MITNLAYWYFPNIFSSEQLSQVHEMFSQVTVDAEDEAAIGVTKIAKVKMAQWIHFKKSFEPLEQAFLRINQEQFGYNIWPQNDANYIRLNEYSKVFFNFNYFI